MKHFGYQMFKESKKKTKKKQYCYKSKPKYLWSLKDCLFVFLIFLNEKKLPKMLWKVYKKITTPSAMYHPAEFNNDQIFSELSRNSAVIIEEFVKNWNQLEEVPKFRKYHLISDVTKATQKSKVRHLHFFTCT